MMDPWDESWYIYLLTGIYMYVDSAKIHFWLLFEGHFWSDAIFLSKGSTDLFAISLILEPW